MNIFESFSKMVNLTKAMDKVRILIVEDELIIAEDMKDMLEDLGYDVVGITGEEQEAKRLLAATEPDIVMLDITLGRSQSGLDVAKHINENVFIPFVFCTSYADKGTIEKAKDLHPHGYLVKPFVQEDLFSAIEIALSNFSNRTDGEDDQAKPGGENLIIRDSLFVKVGNLYQKVKFQDILWVSPDGNYSTINQRESGEFLVRMPLKDFHSQLPGEKFFRVHKSYIVNVDHISAINNNSLFIEGNEIPLGKSFRDILLNKLKKLQ